MGPVVTYGGTKIEAAKQREDNKTAVYLSPSDEKLKNFLDMKTPTCKTEVQRVSEKVRAWVDDYLPWDTKLTAHNVPSSRRRNWTG